MGNNTVFKWSFILPQYWPIWVAVGLLWLISKLPRSSKYAVGAWFGRVLFHIAKSRRNLALANIGLAFPELDHNSRLALVKQHFESLGISFIELTFLWWKGYKFDAQKNEPQDITFIGLENLRQAEAHAKGVLVLVPHFTHIDSSNFFFSLVGEQMPVYRPNDNPVLDYLILKARSLGDLQQVNIPYTETRTIIKALKQGQNVGFLPDQRYRGKGHIQVPFFGHLAKSHSSTSKIAKITGCKVILMFTRRLGTRYEVHFLPELDNFPSGNEVEDTLRLHKLYEAEIRQNPSQYLWVHNRWDLKQDSSGKYVKNSD